MEQLQVKRFEFFRVLFFFALFNDIQCSDFSCKPRPRVGESKKTEKKIEIEENILRFMFFKIHFSLENDFITESIEMIK